MFKKLFVLVSLLALAACSTSNTNKVEERNYTADNNCCTKSYTVSQPVEVIYKNVTYTTVYEPKTYTQTSYVRKPYNGECGAKETCR